MNIENELKNIIAKSKFGIQTDEINDSVDLVEDLAFDSINMIELVCDIEDYFEIDMEDYMEINVLRNFRELCEIVAKLVAAENQ